MCVSVCACMRVCKVFSRLSLRLCYFYADMAGFFVCFVSRKRSSLLMMMMAASFWDDLDEGAQSF